MMMLLLLLPSSFMLRGGSARRLDRVAEVVVLLALETPARISTLSRDYWSERQGSG